MKKAIFVVAVCILSSVALVVYSHDDQAGCYNTYQCRAIHATLTCHDLGVYGDEYLAGFLLAENDITVLGAVNSGSVNTGNCYIGGFLTAENDISVLGVVNAGWVYADGVDLLDRIDTHISEDEILTCSDVEDCFSKRINSSGAVIQCTGQGALSKGMAIVPFDEIFADGVDAAKPIIVLVTPTDAACKGIAVVKTGINEQIEEKAVSGFCAVELNGGESDSTFNWQALGTRK